MDDAANNVERAAETLMAGTGLSLLDAARLICSLRDALPPEMAPHEVMMSCHHIIRLGLEAFAQEKRTVSFRSALEKSLASRACRRKRTLAEIRQCCHRIVRHHPELSEMPVRRITPEYCRSLIMDSHHTPATQNKAHRLLHSIFAFCIRYGWCATNPLDALELPHVEEKKVDVLTMAQVRRLVATVRRPEHFPCAPAVGLMLWAGIRPTELTRLRWQDVRLRDQSIMIEARHSKTGGARQVHIYPVLALWLKYTAPFRLPHAYIVPRAWDRRWRKLRQAAGFANWHPDALRHTFASYHLKKFHDYSRLQLDMGHANIYLLRTRYLSMRGITREAAEEFWGKDCFFAPEKGASEAEN